MASDAEKEQKLPTVNIVVAGTAGVGKSTLLNVMFGMDLTGAEPDKGLLCYKKSSVHIWETSGLELDFDPGYKKHNTDVVDLICDFVEGKDSGSDDSIHAVWYCINSAQQRIRQSDINLIEKLSKPGIPLIIVMTNCICSEKTSMAFEQEIKNVLDERGISGLPIVQVLAMEYEIENPLTGEIITIPAKGTDKLINLTASAIPEQLRAAFTAAQNLLNDPVK